MSTRMKVYRRHHCARQHRTYRSFAKCIWRRAVWVVGEGPYATVARCRALTVMLHGTVAEAEESKRIIDNSACGGLCHGAAGHDLVCLVDPVMAEEWT